MKFALFLILVSGFICSCSSQPLRKPAQNSDRNQADQVQNGPLDDCEQRSLFEKNDEMTWICNDNYVQISTNKKFEVKRSKQIKIGEFNLYHLGDDESRLKDYDAVALIMDQWDVVGGTELMPVPTEAANQNRDLRELLKEKGKAALPANSRVVEPGYYKLLKALQKRDPSWTLIFQPMPEGEGNTGEMAGFYYRGKLVQPREWAYCPQGNQSDPNFGCLIQTTPQQQKLISRRAFVSAFKSGNFDFVAVVGHARFRPPTTAQIKAQEQELCSKFSPKDSCEISKDKIGRFYEIKVVADDFQKIEKFDADIIYMGDYNLDYSPATEETWKAALSSAEGYQVYQLQNTTLSLPTQKLASSYDHFVLRSNTLSECDLKSIRPFDFTQIGNAKIQDPVLNQLKYLLDPKTADQVALAQKTFLDKQVHMVKTSKTPMAQFFSSPEKAKFQNLIDQSTARLKKNKFWLLREYLSDHVPIEMTCNTTHDDD